MAWVRRRLDLPWLQCSECQTLHEQDALTFPYPCDLCPNRLLLQTGEVGRYAYEVYHLLAQNPLDQPPAWETLFDMVGITHPKLKREVYERVCERVRIEREHAKADDPEEKAKRTWTNPNL